MAKEEQPVKEPFDRRAHMARMVAMRDPTKRKNPPDYTKRKFFLGGKLYGRLYTDRTKNIVIAWCSTDQKRVVLGYHDVLNHSERPYSTRQVARLLNRSYPTFQTIMQEGDIARPERYVSPGTKTAMEKLPFMWTKEDILEAHTVLLTKGHGRPNKYGEHRAYPMVSRPELLALLRNDITMYVKDSQGNMVPTWKAII